MRVWIIHQNAYAPSQSASTRHFALARELTQRGHEVLIVASSFCHKSQRETRLRAGETTRREIIDGVPYVWLRTPSYRGNGAARLWNMVVFTLRAWRRVGFRLDRRPDVIIGSSPHLFTPWAAMRLARTFQIPFVLELRDLWPAVPIEIGGMSARHPLMILMGWLERTYYRNADRIISVLPYASRHIADCIGRDDHVAWLPNGSPLEAVADPVSPQGPIVFMYAGAHSVYSGLDVVLEAARILEQRGHGHGFRLRLVGEGPEKPRLMARAGQLQLKTVSFEPAVPRSSIFSLLQEADAFLMVYRNAPVLRWGLCPNKLYDYMAAGRPTVFAVGSANNPVAEANAGITVAPDNAHSLASAMIELSQVPHTERLAMGQRGRAYVEQHHSFPKLALRLEEILQEVVNDSPGQRSARVS